MKKKIIMLTIFVMCLTFLPKVSTYADSNLLIGAEATMEDTRNVVETQSMNYMAWIGAGIKHDPETGYFCCGGDIITCDYIHYRCKSTLELLRSYYVVANGKFIVFDSYSKKYNERGDHTNHYYYRGYYDAPYSYATRHRVDIYYGTTENVIETEDVTSKWIYVAE